MPRSLRHAVGFSLIEVMIAVLVMAIGMLGIAAMQAASLRNTQSSGESNQAVLYTYAIIDSMRANKDVAVINGYNLGSATTWICNPPARVDPPVSAADLAANDRNEWIVALRTNLSPTACGRIICVNAECRVGVQWDDSRATNGNAAREVETRTVL